MKSSTEDTHSVDSPLTYTKEQADQIIARVIAGKCSKLGKRQRQAPQSKRNAVTATILQTPQTKLLPR